MMEWMEEPHSFAAAFALALALAVVAAAVMIGCVGRRTGNNPGEVLSCSPLSRR